MDPLFIVQGIPDRNVPDKMKMYKEKTSRKTIKATKMLLGIMKTRKILLYTHMIRWCLQRGFRFTVVHELVEYKQGNPL